MRTEPRVLLDATAIPAERGGVGRYVDGLVAGAGRRGRRAVGGLPEPRCGGLLPAGAAQPDHPDGRGAEQPPGPARLGADHAVPAGQAAAGGRHPFTALHDAAGRVGARAWSPCTTPRSSPTAGCTWDQGAVLPGLDPDVAAPGGGVRGAQQGHRRRAGPLHPRRGRTRSWWPITGWTSRSSGCRSRRRSPRVAEFLGLGDRPWIALPRHPGAAQERAGAGPGLHPGDDHAGRTGRSWCWPGAPGWDAGVEPAVAAVPAGMTVLRPGHLPFDLLPGLARRRRRWSPTRAWGRASACRCWRRWPAAPPC